MEKEKKICLTVKAFLENPNFSMLELSELKELKGISSSSIQRYLNDPLIEKLFDEETFKKIQELLNENMLSARKKGGINSFKKTVPTKNARGRFTGNQKATDNYRLEKKCGHILSFASIFMQNPYMDLQGIADHYNERSEEDDKVTKDYVFDCLSENDHYHLLSDELWNQLIKQLENRRKIGNFNGARVTNGSRKR